MDGHMSCAR